MNTPRRCAECGKEFQPKRATALFCANKCRDDFHRLIRRRGDVLAVLSIAAATTRGRYPGAIDKELASYARREADALISTWAAHDRAAGRDCAAVVRQKMEASWRGMADHRAVSLPSRSPDRHTTP